MAKRNRVSVNVAPVASHYAAENERIVEFMAPNGVGGLISLRYHEDGTVSIEPYRLDPGCKVWTPSNPENVKAR